MTQNSAINGHEVRPNPFEDSMDGPVTVAADPDNPAVIEAQKSAMHKRKVRWAAKRYDVASLGTIPEPWARRLAAAIERRDAGRDPLAAVPTLTFKGDDAVSAGASDDQIATLSPLTPADTAAFNLRAAALREDARTQVRVMARSIAAGRAAVMPPDPVGLDALLAEPDDDAAYRFAEVWPAGGRVLLAAQFKAGKSTTVGNATRSLVDGDPFLGRFGVAPVGKVAIIDTEMDRRHSRRTLRDQGIRNTGAITVVPLRGAVSAFDITDPAIRSRWARQLEGADVVILDCLRPVLDALGLSEDKDAGKVLVAFDALLAEIGATEGMVVTHMGHQSERARGDSRLVDWADALWKIVRDEAEDDTSRSSFFSALGRDVAIPEGQLTFDPATRHLTYSGGSRRDSAGLAAVPELLAIVAANPGRVSKRQAEKQLCAAHGVTQKDARSAIRKAIADGAVTVTKGPRNAWLLSPAVELTAAQINPFDAKDGE